MARHLTAEEVYNLFIPFLTMQTSAQIVEDYVDEASAVFTHSKDAEIDSIADMASLSNANASRDMF